jgi:CubicO group peptidase (beta-lactamase class C family)
MRETLKTVAVVFIVASLGCSGDDTDGSSGGSCIPNQSSACTCNDGNEGIKTCGEDGTWGECSGCAGGEAAVGGGGAGGAGGETGGTGGSDEPPDAAAGDGGVPDAAMSDAADPDGGIDAASLVDAAAFDASNVVPFEWPVSTPEEQGMSSAILERARDYAFRPGKNTQGVVVVRGGAIVAEWYAEGKDADSWATSWSMGKSFTSAMIGIAVHEGYIANIDLSIADFYPEFRGTAKEKITIRDVLHMASGLSWDEGYVPVGGERTDVIEMYFSTDELAYAKSVQVAYEPGLVFSYSSGDAMLLSGIIEAAVGKNVYAYAREKLFDPIGMAPVHWWQDGAGHTLTYCCVDATSRDYAQFGLLFLRNGVWEGEQVVPAAWVAESTAPSPASSRYGMQWWMTGRDSSAFPDDMYAARGHDTQRIFVVPSLDLVVVRNGYYDKSPGLPVAPEGIGYVLGEDLLMELGLVEYGTLAPDSWSDQAFLEPILDSIQ